MAVSCSPVPSDRRHQADSFTKYLWKNICCCILSHCCVLYTCGGWDQDMMVLGRGLPPHPGTAGGSVWIQHLLLQVLPPYKRHPRLPSPHIQCSRVCKKQLFSLWTGVQRKIGPLLIKLHGGWLKTIFRQWNHHFSLHYAGVREGQLAQ